QAPPDPLARKGKQDRKERRVTPALQACKDPWILQGQKVTKEMLVRQDLPVRQEHQDLSFQPVQRDLQDLREPQQRFRAKLRCPVNNWFPDSSSIRCRLPCSGGIRRRCLVTSRWVMHRAASLST